MEEQNVEHSAGITPNAQENATILIDHKTETPALVPRELTSRFPHIISVDVNYVELLCKLCGMNGNQRGLGFFKGIAGLRAHLCQMHGVSIPRAASLEYAQQRELSAEQLETACQDPQCPPEAVSVAEKFAPKQPSTHQSYAHHDEIPAPASTDDNVPFLQHSLSSQVSNGDDKSKVLRNVIYLDSDEERCSPS